MSAQREAEGAGLDRGLLDDLDEDGLRELVESAHAADLAQLMNRVDREAAAALFQAMDGELRAEVFTELDEGLQEALLGQLPNRELGEIIGGMESDDAADVLQTLRDQDEERADTVLQSLEPELRDDLQALLEYGEDTAGGVMATEFVAVTHDTPVDAAIGRIRELAASRDIQDVYSVFVVDGAGHLLGSVSLQTLLLARRDRRLGELMDTDIRSVPVHMDQERLAALAVKYDLVSIPVVDDDGVLVGRVTMDDVYDIVGEEAAEDIARISGTDEEVLEHSTLVIVRERLPWLLLGLAGGLCAALVMSGFGPALGRSPQSVYFVPIVMGMGGNAGIQSSTVVVRGLATGELRTGDLWQRLWKELKVSLLIGLTCALLVGLAVSLVLGNLREAGVVTLSLLCVILQASVIGGTMPIVLKRMGIDPAIATGPFITTGNDILGVTLYLGLVNLFL